jgi:hypothetical protein
MNIVEAFLKLDKLNETVHLATGINFPEVVLDYEDLEIEFYFKNNLITKIVDYTLYVDGLDAAAVLVENLMTMEDYPEFFSMEDLNSKEADEWLIAHWSELLDKYNTQLSVYYENTAKEKAADIAYAEAVDYDEEMYATRGKGYDYAADGYPAED